MFQHISVHNDIKGAAKFWDRSVKIQLNEISAGVASVTPELSVALYPCHHESLL
jgi:hypothetical protein